MSQLSLRAGVTGAQMPGNAGGSRVIAGVPIKRAVVPLVEVRTSGSSHPTGTVTARIQNPSRRLSCGFSVAFEPQPQQDLSNFAAATWTIRALRPGSSENNEALMHVVQSGVALPEHYEADTSVRLLEVVSQLTVPLDGSGNPVAGTWSLVVEWEPNMGGLCIEDIETMYSGCSAKVTRGQSSPLAP